MQAAPKEVVQGMQLRRAVPVPEEAAGLLVLLMAELAELDELFSAA